MYSRGELFMRSREGYFGTAKQSTHGWDIQVGDQCLIVYNSYLQQEFPRRNFDRM